MKYKDMITQKIYEITSGYTVMPFCFLPMIIVSAGDSKSILEGNIPLAPMVKPEDAQSLAQTASEKYTVASLEDAVVSGKIMNLSDLCTLKLSLIPLVFRDGKYKRPSKKLISQGDTAIIILEPEQFMQRLNAAVHCAYPNVRVFEVATAQYGNVTKNIENWNLFTRSKKEAWKKEIFAMARIQPNINLAQHMAVDTEYVHIGDISNIAAVIPTKNLVKGCFPQDIYADNVIADLNDSIPQMKGIQGYVFSVAANVLEIEPVKDWIEKFQSILPSDEWVCNSAIDKLFQDGASKPRLVFHHANGLDKIFIGINRIEFTFAYYENRERAILTDIMRLIDGKVDTRYCHMKVETNANLGTVRNLKAMKTAFMSETKTYVVNGLEAIHRLETNYNIKVNILGIPAAQRAWHYSIQTKTPDYEHIAWYSLDAVLEFCDKAVEYNKNQITKLMRGNVYVRYKKI